MNNIAHSPSTFFINHWCKTTSTKVSVCLNYRKMPIHKILIILTPNHSILFRILILPGSLVIIINIKRETFKSSVPGEVTWKISVVLRESTAKIILAHENLTLNLWHRIFCFLLKEDSQVIDNWFSIVQNIVFSSSSFHLHLFIITETKIYFHQPTSIPSLLPYSLLLLLTPFSSFLPTIYSVILSPQELSLHIQTGTCLPHHDNGVAD